MDPSPYLDTHKYFHYFLYKPQLECGDALGSGVGSAFFAWLGVETVLDADKQSVPDGLDQPSSWFKDCSPAWCMMSPVLRYPFHAAIPSHALS